MRVRSGPLFLFLLLGPLVASQLKSLCGICLHLKKGVGQRSLSFDVVIAPYGVTEEEMLITEAQQTRL